MVFFLGILFLLYTWEKNTGSVPAAKQPAPSEDLVYYREAWYRPRKGLETVLAIGVDQAAVDGTLRRDQAYEQADFLLLLVIDRENESCSAIHINRDTMAEISMLDDNTNEALGTMTAQLALAHTYGNSPTARCRNTVAAVSGLVVMDDLSEVDSELVQGETVTLQGRQALAYVQARRGLEDPSNLRRMERQRQYLESLQKQLRLCVEGDGSFITSTILELNEYLTSDCSVEKMSALADLLEEYGVAEYRTLEGEATMGEKYVEYYVDEAAARDMVMEMFYEEAG